MSRLRRRPDPPEEVVERAELREYRYLLRTAPAADLERLHRRAVAGLDPLVRATILVTARERLHSGRDLSVDDTARIARLLTVGELRTPGIVVSALSEVVHQRLATAVLRDELAVPLRAGYDDWDGVEPTPAESATRLTSAVS
jgi:hypothetical protein